MSQLSARYLNIVKSTVADPHHFNADLDPAFHLNVDPDPDPAPHQSDGNLRPVVYVPSRAPFLASSPPCERQGLFSKASEFWL